MAIKNINYAGWRTLEIDITNPVSAKFEGLLAALDSVWRREERRRSGVGRGKASDERGMR